MTLAQFELIEGRLARTAERAVLACEAPTPTHTLFVLCIIVDAHAATVLLTKLVKQTPLDYIAPAAQRKKMP
jgi:hypothetical protein